MHCALLNLEYQKEVIIVYLVTHEHNEYFFVTKYSKGYLKNKLFRN